VGASGIGRYRLTADGVPVFDDTVAMPPGADDAEGIMAPPQVVRPLPLAAGDEVELVLVHDVLTSLDVGTAFQLLLEAPHGTDDEEIERAVALARDADVAIVVVGTTEEVESEGFDRTSLDLPGRQDELVQRVAEVNDRTVVVVNAGAPVLLPWAEQVAAVLLVWFPGMEFGNALADVLFGRAEPGGRLPTTWPLTGDGVPATQPDTGTLRYTESLWVGHRAGGRSRYPFGHGHGYTTWAYGTVGAPRRTGAGQDVTVRVPLRNTGERPGREVVQIYLSRPDGAVARPVRWLAGFTGVRLHPGGSATAEITVPARAFAHWDEQAAQWRVEPGTFELHAGASAEDLRTSTLIDVHP
jgi:beta-glucosidase